MVHRPPRAPVTRACGAALLLLAAGCAPTPMSTGLAVAPTGAVRASQVPSGPCDPSRVIAHHGADAPQPPAGLVVENLYPTTLWTEIPVQQDGEGPGVPVGLKTSMRHRFVLSRANGPLTSDDMGHIDQEGFTEVEYVCPLAGMGIPAPGAGPGPGMGTTWGWHGKATGAADVVPFITAELDPEDTVRVAILDTGVDPIVPTATYGWSFYPSSVSPTPWRLDALGHGTSVASILYDMTGGKAELISIKVLDDAGRGSGLSLVRGLMVAAYHHAHVLNLSLGYPKEEGVMWGRLPTFQVEALQAVYATGARTFAAAGNRCGGGGGSCQEFYPAAAPWSIGGATLGVTSVSGLSPQGRMSIQAVPTGADLWAPSELICTPTSPAVNPNHYQRLSGTSFAVPQAAGALALFEMAHLHHTGALDPDDVGQIQLALMSSASPVPYPGPCTTGGRLDLCATMTTLFGASAGPTPCTTWATTATPQADNCPWQNSNPTTATQTFTKVAAGFEPSTGAPPIAVDTLGEAVWCNGYSTAPSRPVCTSCEVEFDTPTAPDTTYSSFSMALRLRGDWDVFEDWQLRLTDAAGATTYIALDLVGTLDPGWLGGGTATYEGSLSPGLSSMPTEAWLVSDSAAAYGWSGMQLLIR